MFLRSNQQSFFSTLTLCKLIMTQYQGVKGSPVAQASKMNKKRADKDMASLVMIFDKLSRPQVNSPLNPPQEEQGAPSHCFSPKALITAFFESFSSRSDADACLKHAIIFAGSFDIDLLLNHKPPDIVDSYINYCAVSKVTASTLISGKSRNFKNLRSAFGYTMIATSFILLQWKDHALSVISDVDFDTPARMRNPDLDRNDCSWLRTTFNYSEKMIRTRKDNADGDWTAFIVEAFEEAIGE